MIAYTPPIFDTKPAIILTVEETPLSNNQTTGEYQPKEYTVIAGDSLEKIASEQHTTVSRLFSKNLGISDPNVIEVGWTLVIPAGTEVLAERAMISTAPQGFAQVTRTPETWGSLIGSMGYAKPGGNCVDEPGVNSPRNGTNPISWPVLSRTPTIGATALFNFNHTGVVTGIWSNGDLEIRHQNYSGGKHRFPASAFRGFR